MKKNNSKIGQIKLRALTKSDLEKTLEWHNQDDIRDLYAGHPFPVNREMEEKWYEKILYSNYPTTVFGIEKIKEKKLIGIVLLKDIHSINRSCEFAIYIGDKDERGKGYSKEATLLSLEFSFNKLGMNRVFLKVLEENMAAKKLYEKCNFKMEGILRNSNYKNGEYKSEIIMSILKDEFINNDL